MEQHIPPSSLEPIKKPIYEHTKKPVDKTKYLDEQYNEEWLDNYFNIKVKK
tara:strand:- start:41 stop:193 length:153 start_codon:yes stop_codon:yes gene_type:complete